MSSATAETKYYVSTIYRVVDEGASHTLGRIHRQGSHANSTIALLSRGISRLGVLMGGMTVGAAAVGAVRKTFGNLNDELNATLRLGSQFNAGLVFDPDPLRNWNASLKVSRGLIRGLVQDAAKLPGELSDFVAVSNILSGSVLAAGGNAARIRKLTGQLAFVGPMSGSETPQVAAAGVMRMLLGNAGIESPITRYLVGAGLVPDAKTFNKLPAPERLERISRAFEKLADNPGLRESFIRTFETQIGTLSDALFGTQGIGGKIFGGQYKSLLDTLVKLNGWLDAHGSSVAETIAPTGGITPAMRAQLFSGLPEAPSSGFGAILGDMFTVWSYGLRLLKRRQIADELTRTELRQRGFGGGLLSGFDPGYIREYNDAFPLNLQEVNLKSLKAFQPEEPEAETATAAQPQINQVFNVKLDLKSDTSPDAIATKVQQGLARATNAPRVGSRRVSFEDAPFSPVR